MAEWHFDRPSPKATNRDSNAAEFFAGSESADALVRESIQNSLDASDDDPTTDLEVRFTFRTVPLEIVQQHFSEALIHFTSEGSGLTDLPDFNSPCRVLLVEDFGTTGLQGDERASRPPRSGVKNNFFNFFRAEARTEKDAHKFGQRGVGKDVFVSASRVRSIFGLTVRENDPSRQKLVMGKCILKGHYSSESDEDYFQDGFFGEPPDPEDATSPVFPSMDEAFIEGFQRDFGINREGLTGLSVVVPWVADDIDLERVAVAAIKHYFYPILRKRLQVTICSDDTTIVLDSNSINTEIERLETRERDELIQLMKLANWSRQQRDSDFLRLNEPESKTAWKWKETLMNEEDAVAAAERFIDGDRIAFRIPVTVTKRDETLKRTYFDVYLEQAVERTGRVRPTFLRGDLLIADVKSPTCPGVRAIVLAVDRPLSGFLGSSENPAHTRWEHRRHKDAYAAGAATCLEFVTHIVSRIVGLLSKQDSEADRTIFADLFPTPPDEDEGRQKRRTRTSKSDASKNPAEPENMPDLPPPPARRYSFNATEDGFTVASFEGGQHPDRIVIRAAYNVRRGSAFKKYKTSDFRFDSRTTSRGVIL